MVGKGHLEFHVIDGSTKYVERFWKRAQSSARLGRCDIMQTVPWVKGKIYMYIAATVKGLLKYNIFLCVIHSNRVSEQIYVGPASIFANHVITICHKNWTFNCFQCCPCL